MSPHHPESAEESIAAAAAAWIVRRDRGLTAAEEASLRRWLDRDPRHARVLAERERAWRLFDSLAGSGSVTPAAAPPRRRARPSWTGAAGWAAAALAAAAVVAFLLAPVGPAALRPAPTLVPARPSAALVAVERRFLEDGSIVDLADGAQVETAFSPTERRLRLLRGAAHFAVAHQPERPFIVGTQSGVEARALGTAFDVRVGDDGVEVRVSSGRVEVRRAPEAGPSPGAGLPVLQAGQSVRIPSDPAAGAGELATLPPPSADRSAPPPSHYEFERTPLVRIVEELNRRGDLRLSIEDPEIAPLPLYASFRASNVDAFLRLLEATGEVSVERAGEVVRLRRAR